MSHAPQQKQDNIIVDTYGPEDAAAFKALNIAWIERFFAVEPFDEEILSKPDVYIFGPGGEILMARDSHTGLSIGTGAIMPLKPEDDGTPVFEITKMAVDPSYQGSGVGRRILKELLVLAQEKGARKAIIYSNRSLEGAIHLYKSEGFSEIPIEDAIKQRYVRCNIKLEYILNVARSPKI